MIVVENLAKSCSKRMGVEDVRLCVQPGAVRTLQRPGGSAKSASTVRALRNTIREVAVLEVTGQLSDVVEDLDRAIELALAEGPRGVVCDLSGVLQGAAPTAVEVLATAGRHVRDWRGIPVAVASPDPQVREMLRTHPLGASLIVAESIFSAISAVLATPTVPIERLQLAPHPTAPRAARNFVTRTLLDWRLGRAIPFASKVVSELVSSSSIDAGTDIDLSIAWDHGSLRLTVRDHGPALLDQPSPDLDLHRRGLNVVAGLSRTFGSMPTADGGKVAWAVLNAPRPQLLTRSPSEPHTTTSESPVFTDGRGVTELPFCAGSSRKPA